ncbi:MAG: HNH endonuclease signature motif containing protein [Chlamydiota bacterium]|nr:HNH endonuclease signature motif containing protein [Chlamydiota bacterium]
MEEEKGNYRKIREKAFLRDNFICQISKQELPTDELDIHHINPKTQGGPSSLDNIQTLSKKCHRQLHKDTKTLDEYAFEYKTFNNVEKNMPDYSDDLVEESTRPRADDDGEENAIDVEELEDMDKTRDFDDEV